MKKYTKNIFASLSIAILTFMLVGCATPPPRKMYTGVTRPQSEVATIKCTSYRKNNFISGSLGTVIHQVDGVNVTSFFDSLNGLYPEGVYVLPGKHDLHLKYTDGLHYADEIVWLNAEAGKTYVAKSVADGYKVAFFLEDEETGEKVGGIKFESQ